MTGTEFMIFGQSAFYRVEKPLLVLKHRGTCTTNDFVGASMMLRLVKEAIQAKPGDEIHALIGGCFLIDGGGVVSEFSLRTRKEAFERVHGPFVSDQDILASLAKSGYLVEIEGPHQKPDYRQNPADEKFVHLHDEVIWTEHSDLFNRMKAAFPEVVSVINSHPTAQITIADFGLCRDVVVSSWDGNEMLWKLTCREEDDEVSIQVGTLFDASTGILQTVTDSLTPDVRITQREGKVRIGSNDESVIANIDSHLAMAIENYLYPASAPIP